MMTTGSPAATLCPTFAAIWNTFPAAPAFTSIPPAAAAGAAGAGAAAGAAATGAATGAAATGAAHAPFSSTVTSYATPFTVIV